jgi:molybdopterin molybdotransferase
LDEEMTVAPREVEVRPKEKALISLDDACLRVAAYVTPLEVTETLPVAEALGRYLAAAVCAPIALPPFDQSAMDGYAFAASSIDGIETELPVISRMMAGAGPAATLPSGSAARIFTGAAIPLGADTVVMQEHVRLRDSKIIVEGPLRRGSNIRYRGEDVAPGDALLDRAQRLDARHLALLSAVGISQIQAIRRPRVAIVSTGDELRQPGGDLDEGCIFDCNRPMLMGLARQAGLEVIDGGSVQDTERGIAARLADLASVADLILTTGGASFGDADYSEAGLQSAGAKFERLSMAVKPGKPAVVGRIAQAAYLGLPGNPVAAMISWLTLGHAMLSALLGVSTHRRSGIAMPLAAPFEHRLGRSEFAPARLVTTAHGSCVEIISRGGSARLKPLILAEGLAEISSAAGNVGAGHVVLFHPFQSGFAI